MSYDYKDGLSGDSLARYNAKLSSVDSDCPYRCPADEWTNDPTQWPPLEYADLYHYLIRSPGTPTCVSDLHLDLRDNNEFLDYGKTVELHVDENSLGVSIIDYAYFRSEVGQWCLTASIFARGPSIKGSLKCAEHT